MNHVGPIIRVLVVDDSAVVRAFIRAALARHAQIEVVGEAADGAAALRQLATLRPDVVTLDVEMPGMNGIGVLERAAGKAPVSFLMVSTLTQAGARVTFEALSKGAFDYVAKPQLVAAAAKPEFQEQLQRKVLAAAQAKGRTRHTLLRPATGAAPQLPPNKVTGWVVGVGISCGGPQTLHEVLPMFPSDFVPILVTQHMPAQFTGPFAKHLNAACAMHVKEAEDGEAITQGCVYIAPGSQHLKVARRGMQLCVALDAGPPVSGHRPAVDVMFGTLARVCPTRTIAVVMTGMGRDGAQGVVELAKAGAVTVAQDEKSSFVYGMPRAAYETGCVQHVAAAAEIPAIVAGILRRGRAPAASVR
jgi:two-component system chemotaxis response regulator CheB